jgi:hypothetical protein
MSFLFSSCNVFKHSHCKYPFRSLYSTSYTKDNIKTSINNLPVKLPSKETLEKVLTLLREKKDSFALTDLLNLMKDRLKEIWVIINNNPTFDRSILITLEKKFYVNLVNLLKMEIGPNIY